MHMTVLGFILVPVALLWMNRPTRLLQLTLVSAVFEAAAALVFGSFGLQLAMVPGLLFIFYVASQYALGMRYPAEGPALRALFPLIALLLYAVTSAWFLPDLFAGKVFVEPQRPDPELYDVLIPLQSSFGNITQTLYLAINVSLAAAVALFVTRAAIPYRKILVAYLNSGYVVVALVFWQFAHRLTGVPFPDDLLHSNPGWAIVEQALGSVPRMQGPFSEPSALGGYLSGVTFCCLWLNVRGYQIQRSNLLLALSVVCILLSTSTTGLVTLFTGLVITVIVASLGKDRNAVGRLGKTFGLLLLAGLIVIGPVLVLRPSLVDSATTVYESTINKGDSDSYDQRSRSDVGGLNTLVPTYGLGVGWGSYRSSSFIPGLLSNGGIFGVLMVLWLIIRLVQLSRRGRRATPDHAGRILVEGFSASLCTQFCTALISEPMIGSLVFFLQLGCVIGVLARMSIEPGERLGLRGRSWYEAAVVRREGVAGLRRSNGTLHR